MTITVEAAIKALPFVTRIEHGMIDGEPDLIVFVEGRSTIAQIDAVIDAKWAALDAGADYMDIRRIHGEKDNE